MQVGQQEKAAFRRVIRLDGVFDGVALRRLHDTLSELRPGERVTVDLSKVRDIDDCSVTGLAQLAAGPLRVEIRGLRQHQIRLLQYFGVAPAAL